MSSERWRLGTRGSASVEYLALVGLVTLTSVAAIGALGGSVAELFGGDGSGAIAEVDARRDGDDVVAAGASRGALSASDGAGSATSSALTSTTSSALTSTTSSALTATTSSAVTATGTTPRDGAISTAGAAPASATGSTSSALSTSAGAPAPRAAETREDCGWLSRCRLERVGSGAWEFVKGVGRGAWGSVKGTLEVGWSVLKFGGRLVTGDRETWQSVGNAVHAVVTDPVGTGRKVVEVGKAIVGHYVDAIKACSTQFDAGKCGELVGEIGLDVAIGIATGGSALAATRGGRVAALLARHADDAADASRVQRLLARVARKADDLPPRARMRATLRHADHRAGIRQITGKDITPGQTTFTRRIPADPSVDILPDGRVHIYGTADDYVEFASLDDMLRGGDYKVLPIDSPRPMHSWDNLVHRWDDGTEVMYGGAMTPTGGRPHAVWPHDNWNRRIYPYTRDANGTWIRHDRPLFNPPPDTPAMVGHTYGHDFKIVTRTVDGRPVRERWLFHEEIVSEGPLRTEIFARRMDDPFTASNERVRLLSTEIDGHVVGRRSNGEILIEGPRPFQARVGDTDYHFITYSSGDFASNNYDIHFAWRRGDAIGEYTPYLDRAGDQVRLRGFAEQIKERYQLSWVGRADVVTDADGNHWAVFHGVDRTIRPEIDYAIPAPAEQLGTFERNLYAVPMRIDVDASGAPVIELLDLPR